MTAAMSASKSPAATTNCLDGERMVLWNPIRAPSARCSTILPHFHNFESIQEGKARWERQVCSCLSAAQRAGGSMLALLLAHSPHCPVFRKAFAATREPPVDRFTVILVCLGAATTCHHPRITHCDTLGQNPLAASGFLGLQLGATWAAVSCCAQAGSGDAAH